MTKEEAIMYLKDADVTVGRKIKTKTAEALEMAIKALQEPKTGHWKFKQRGKYIDICCSKCGFQRVKEYAYNYTVDQISEQDIEDFFSNSNMNFCENCGAKMFEPHEVR